MKTRFFACLCAALLAQPSAAEAQRVPARLTLEDAIALAHQHNPTLRRALNDQTVHEAGTLQAWGGLLPRVNANSVFGLGTSTTLTGQDAFGRPVSLDEPESFRNSSARQGVSASLTLFDGGRALRGVAASRAQERSGEARINAEQRRLDAAVARAYYRAMRAERGVQLERTLLAAAEDNLDRTQELLRIAASSHPDVLGARVQVASQQQSVSGASAEAAKAKLALLESIGIDEAPGFELVSELPAAFDPRALDAEALVAAAREASPGVQQAMAAAAAARQRTLAQRGSRWPTISASAGFSRSMNLRSYDAFLELNPQNRALSFGLDVSFPLFTGFQTSYNVTQAVAAENNAREDERAAVLAAAREVRSALLDLEAAYDALTLSHLRAELAVERLGMAEEQYRLGAIQFVTLQQYIEQAAQAERGALDARFAFADALVTLEEKAATRIRP